MKVVSEIKTLNDQLMKRSVLSIAVNVFDPVRLLEPFTVRGKLMLQEFLARTANCQRIVNLSAGHGLRNWKPSCLSKFPDRTFHRNGAELCYTFLEIPRRARE